ncbi:MAG: S-methyl-5-thioribose-1-phosphate isomerase [Candidatus Omnitrophica bacterium]|nr:S-methyl-5-thioribose-1-phosphate isomerase [Candidatus Omnitrophota bacterium]
MVETLRFRNGKLELVDQRLLPGKFKYVKCDTPREVWSAIKDMTVRGAPAIGITGAYGVYLGIKGFKGVTTRTIVQKVIKTAEYLATSRPTARNLFWGLERMVKTAKDNGGLPACELKKILLNEAHAILEEDKAICRAIGENGSFLVPKGARVLTHCNAGALATADYGTALGVIYSAKDRIREVLVDETRPVLQGARLTAWELVNEGINATLICDNMAAYMMSKKRIDLVVVGADRISANGDTANKIGTYSVAVNAKYHGIPFYVAAPSSTFDLTLRSGALIPIEERDPMEVKSLGGKLITVKGIHAANPAFDVTPAGLITGIITEMGVILKPSRSRVKIVLNRGSRSSQRYGTRA